MVKRKILIVTAILAVMLAMTGIAAAHAVNIYEHLTTNQPNSIDLVPNAVGKTYDLKVSNFDCTPGVGSCKNPTTHKLYYTIDVINDPGGLASSNDIVIDFQELVPAGSFGFQPYTYTQEGSAGTSEILAVRFAAISGAPAGAEYDITIFDDDNNAYSKTSVTIKSNSIPEFPTVALPIAAVIGLVFFFQQRKEKN